MNKIPVLIVFVVFLSGCGGNTSDSSTVNETGKSSNPTAIDTVKHPGGMANQNVISTDTAAMNMQNSINKAKEAGKK
jgi:hypothetical protein